MKKVYLIIGVIVLIGVIIALSVLRNNNSATTTNVSKIYQSSELFTNSDLEQNANNSNATKYNVSDRENINITSAGVYVISGTAKNVTIYVEAGDLDKVQIVLENLSITNETMPVIYVKTADKVFVTSNGSNSLNVTGTFAKDDSNNLNAVVFSKQDITFNGTGTLNIESTQNGITGKDDIKITGGTYNIKSVAVAIRANDSIRIADGNISLNAGTDGLHAENSSDDTKGYVFIAKGNINIEATDDCIHGGSVVQNGLPKILRIFMAILVMLVAFSRIFLGVHTPQDILVGAGAGILVMWLTLLLMKWLKEHPEKDWIVLCIGVALAILLALYAGLKSYPVDYDSEGNVLVEGKKMMNDTFKGVGYCLAFLIGWILERRFVKFSTDIPGMQRVIRVVVGLMGYYVVSLILCTLIKEWIPGSAGTMISCFLQVFYVTFLFPLSIRFLERMRIGT